MLSIIRAISKSQKTKEQILLNFNNIKSMRKNDKDITLYYITYRNYFKEFVEYLSDIDNLKDTHIISELTLIVAYTGNTQILNYLIKHNLLDVKITTENDENCFFPCHKERSY
jgi:biotin synthase-related radical SAM superfamily protein